MYVYNVLISYIGPIIPYQCMIDPIILVVRVLGLSLVGLSPESSFGTLVS